MQGLCRIFASNPTHFNTRIISEIQRECRVLCRACRVFCSARFMYIDFAPSAGNRQRAQDHEQWSFTVFFTDFTKNRVRNADKQGEFVNLPKFCTALALISPPPRRRDGRISPPPRSSLEKTLLPRIVRTERIPRHSFDVS